jgi:ABC-type histidine transport system ATPase subunit
MLLRPATMQLPNEDVSSDSAELLADLRTTAAQKKHSRTSQSKQTDRIVATDICKSFGALRVLQGVSLRAKDGDVITMIGSSGSGKSTFLRCLNLLEVPQSGRITIDETVLDFGLGSKSTQTDKQQIRMLRSKLGMVFQSFNLWSHMTVLENVMAAPVHVHKTTRVEAKERSEALLQRVGLFDRRAYYPSQLSGGQQQRVAIARALAIEPRALLFDEPTSALDPELVGEVLKVIRELAEAGTTMVLVTHEMRFAADVSNKVLFLNQGRIEEEGDPKEMFRAPRTERCREFLRRVL